MSLVQIFESWAEGLLRIAIGAGLVWIGAVEGDGYGLFLEVVGTIFILAGIGEIWSIEVAARRPRRETTMNTIHPALLTCDIPVFYATSEGQTRRIAERLVAIFKERGFSSRAIDLATSDADYVDWGQVKAAVVGASVHAYKHQRTARAFVREYVSHLNTRPSVFVSVSLATISESAAERDQAVRIAREFVDAAEWHADEVVCLAGRLSYTRYGWLTRFIMKRIAQRHGQPADTSRDYEFTNWDEVARVAASLVDRIVAQRLRKAA